MTERQIGEAKEGVSQRTKLVDIQASLAAKFYYAQTTLVLVRWWHHIPASASEFICSESPRHVILNPSFTRDRRSLAENSTSDAHVPALFLPLSSSFTPSSSSRIQFQRGESSSKSRIFLAAPRNQNYLSPFRDLTRDFFIRQALVSYFIFNTDKSSVSSSRDLTRDFWFTKLRLYHIF